MEAVFRLVGRVTLYLCLASVAVLAVAFFVTGARKNAQITSLREHGVPVEVTVTNCIGLLGGSGSNDAGYACRGTYVVDGRRQYEAIPGDTLYSAGTKIRGITVADDPGLLSTAADVAGEHASWRDFVTPTVLLVVLAGLLLVLGLRRRRLLRR